LSRSEQDFKQHRRLEILEKLTVTAWLSSRIPENASAICKFDATIDIKNAKVEGAGKSDKLSVCYNKKNGYWIVIS
jgi:hypothetical protein